MGRSAELRLKSGNGSRETRSESGEERCAMIEVFARLYRTMAYNLAIQIRRPTWQVGRTLTATRSREETALSAGSRTIPRIERQRQFSRRGLGRNSVQFRGRWLASSPDQPT